MNKEEKKEYQNRPSEELKQSRATQKQQDKKREQAKNVLLINSVLNKRNQINPTLAEKALEVINQNSFESQLTEEMLNQFKRRADDLRRDYHENQISGGISPRAIINRSRRIDIQRCQKEIHSIFPAKHTKDGLIIFRTNASQKSKDSYHMVSVQFLNFQAALNAGSNTKELAKAVLNGAVKFDCDCGRHRYWYRYIASVGGFSYGKPETGFPKIRNPTLTGLACKHVIRVMTLLERSQTTVSYMQNMLDYYRKKTDAPNKTQTRKQAQKLKQAIQKEKIHQAKVRQTAKGVSVGDVSSFFDLINPKSLKGVSISAHELAALKKSQLNEAQLRAENEKLKQIIAQLKQLKK